MKIKGRLRALICGGGDLKSVTGETLTNTKWSTLALAIIITASGEPEHGLFMTFVSLSLIIAFLRVLMEAVKYPHHESASGLESNEQVHKRNNRFTHDFRMATSAAALSIFYAYVGFLLYHGFWMWQGFKFWIDYVGS